MTTVESRPSLQNLMERIAAHPEASSFTLTRKNGMTVHWRASDYVNIDQIDEELIAMIRDLVGDIPEEILYNPRVLEYFLAASKKLALSASYDSVVMEQLLKGVYR